MSVKTFKVAGVSLLNGKYKVRYANNKSRAKVLEKNGHTNVELVELLAARVPWRRPGGARSVGRSGRMSERWRCGRASGSEHHGVIQCCPIRKMKKKRIYIENIPSAKPKSPIRLTIIALIAALLA